MRPRTLLYALLAVFVAALVAVACTSQPNPPAASSSSSGGSTPATVPDVTPEPHGIHHLQHLIFIVQENRSFDHYFGTFPGADGIPDEARRADRLRPRSGHSGDCVEALPLDVRS